MTHDRTTLPTTPSSLTSTTSARSRTRRTRVGDIDTLTNTAFLIVLSTDNLISLNNFVLIQFGADTEVVPKESEWFG